jgi:hypothetical protein
MSRPTIMNGIAELGTKDLGTRAGLGRVRQPGGGRKRVEPENPRVKRVLARLLDATTAGDPMSYLLWTNKSTRALAEELARHGCAVSHVTVARCLREMGYSLQANLKTVEGTEHPDRDQQFRYINDQVRRFLRTQDPVVSVDTKKKELVGAFDNRGRRWQRAGRPDPVFLHDFPELGEGKAIPYGTYDVARDEAVVNVGITHETAEFAVESIRRWWRLLGRTAYPHARRMLICADAPPGLESPPAVALGPRGLPDQRVPLPAGNEQMEQGGASPVLVHQHELARPALGQLRSSREPDWRNHDPERAQGQSRPRQDGVRAGPEDCG